MRYPFDPEILDALPEALADKYRQLEADLLYEICSRLKVSGELNQMAVEAIKALRGHGIPLDEIKRKIAEVSRISLSDVDKLLSDVSARNAEYYDWLADAAEITKPDIWLSPMEVAAIIEQTQGEIENITRSMGFAVRSGGKIVRLTDGAEAYRLALDRAALKVRSGVVSYNQAIYDAVRQLSDDGIRTVRYDNEGRIHYDHADVAVRRAVMTGVAQVCHKYSEASAEYLETDLVEVSAHIGARDAGIGPENHKEWQGKVYHWVKDGRKQNPKYRDFEITTGYGTGEGLGGWNCRHSFYPFIEGVSERTYTDEQLRHIDDGHEAEYEGKTYTAYEATQKQRMIERTIRKLKRERDGYKAAGLEDEARAVNARIRRLSGKYKEFSEAAGLKEQRERVKIYTPKKGAALADSGLRRYDITDKAIESVPVVKPEGWSEENAVKLQAAHKELLKVMKDYPTGTEGAALYDMDMKRIGETVTGATGQVMVPDSDAPYVMIHNHPDGQTFSHTDIMNFILRANLKTMTVIGNTGKVFVLQKGNDYDGNGLYFFVKDKLAIIEKAIKDKDEEKYLGIVVEIIKEAKEYGATFDSR